MQQQLLQQDKALLVFCGRVKSYNPKQGYGFLDCPEARQHYNRDVFLHKAQMGELLGRFIGPGTRIDPKRIEMYVRFSVELNRQGYPQARDVARIDGPEGNVMCGGEEADAEGGRPHFLQEEEQAGDASSGVVLQGSDAAAAAPAEGWLVTSAGTSSYPPEEPPLEDEGELLGRDPSALSLIDGRYGYRGRGGTIRLPQGEAGSAAEPASLWVDAEAPPSGAAVVVPPPLPQPSGHHRGGRSRQTRPPAKNGKNEAPQQGQHREGGGVSGQRHPAPPASGGVFSASSPLGAAPGAASSGERGVESKARGHKDPYFRRGQQSSHPQTAQQTSAANAYGGNPRPAMPTHLEYASPNGACPQGVPYQPLHGSAIALQCHPQLPPQSPQQQQSYGAMHAVGLGGPQVVEGPMAPMAQVPTYAAMPQMPLSYMGGNYCENAYLDGGVGVGVVSGGAAGYGVGSGMGYQHLPYDSPAQFQQQQQQQQQQLVMEFQQCPMYGNGMHGGNGVPAYPNGPPVMHHQQQQQQQQVHHGHRW